jgi:hypothetical protein
MKMAIERENTSEGITPVAGNALRKALQIQNEYIFYYRWVITPAIKHDQ